MVIRYVGNFEPSFSTESHLSATLEKLGHTVVRLQEDKTRYEEIVGPCDLFLFTRTWGQTVKKEHLDEFKRLGTPTVSYHLDLYVGLERDGGLGSDPFWNTDFVFTPDGDPKSAEVFKSLGINHYYLKPGVFEDECYIADVPLTRDIIFIGSYGYHPEYPYRQQLIDWLKNTYGSKFEHWGPHGLGHVRGKELNELLASAKITIGDSLTLPGHTHYWSDRVYETMGRGGFLIHHYIPGLEEEFQSLEHLAYYTHGDFQHLKDVIDFYLKTDGVRETIRRKGHEFVKQNCTYTNRLKEALRVVVENSKVS